MNPLLVYLVTTSVYRMANGCLLLAIYWQLMEIGGGSSRALAVSVFLSFLPAVIARNLVHRWVERFAGCRVTAFATLGTSVISLASLQVLDDELGLIGMSFCLWILYFTMESSWESWLVELLGGRPEPDVRSLSAVSMTLSQVSLMLGPLLVGPLSRLGGVHAPFVFAALAYGVVAAALLLRASSAAPKRGPLQHATAEAPTHSRLSACPIAMVVSFALVWPSLAMLNMMFPIHVKASRTTVVDYVGWLDASVSLGMACAGFLVGARAFAVLVPLGGRIILLLAGSLALFPIAALRPGLATSLAAIFFVGVSLGSARILLRTELIRRLPPKDSAVFIANANSWSLFVVGLSVWIYHYTSDLGHFVPWVVISGFLLSTAIALVRCSRLANSTVAIAEG